jgi:serine/threonine-protein kinase
MSGTGGDDPDAVSGDTEYRPVIAQSSGRRGSAARFTPGTLLADRYRIVALLGSGGMGEVYRAEDLKLGQQVALKFLPARVAADPRRVERLYEEVRIGRQVSHPNVCRLYDIGEWQGHQFLAMEYVDGEDLASLLRRIGRLPHDKAMELARDVCAGIAAAHAVGIVHRDLKPANIMIDGRGNARITDFGLAAVADEVAGRGEVVGTPMYMAPEQILGEDASPRTDLYSLGLILFEMFTGRRLFETVSSDLAGRRSVTQSQSLSSQTREIDPAIQRVILRCLEEQPSARPASIHSVIAALPGGDPLQAAVDAGETPSPQMVAAAGETGDLQPRVAFGLFAVAIAGLMVAAILYGRNVLFRRVPLPKEPAVLIERARTIIERAGYSTTPKSYAFYFETNPGFMEYATKNAQGSRDPWSTIAKARPGIFVFGYRQSQRDLLALNDQSRVITDDPPRTIPGMVEVFVDTRGRLLSFSAVPPQSHRGATQTPDWNMFFAEAGGDLENITPVAPSWTPPVSSDRQFAWTARFHGEAAPVRIEAASHDGKPVWFEMIGPWREPMRAEEAQSSPQVLLDRFGLIVGNVVPLIGAMILARRNVNRGRGDRRGATRIALFVFCCVLVARLFRIDHVSDWLPEWRLVTGAVAWSLFEAMMVWLFYVAIEPFVRRRWPHLLISMLRLLDGRWRDPMVARDVLIGCIAGVGVVSLRLVTSELPTWFGRPSLSPFINWTSPLASIRHLVFLSLTQLVAMGIETPLFFAVMLVLLSLLFRKRLYALAFVWVLVAVFINGPGTEPIRIAVGAAMATIVVFVLSRWGLLALAVTVYVDMILASAPITLDPGSWYFGRSAVVLLAFAAIATYGAYVSLAGKPIFAATAEEF